MIGNRQGKTEISLDLDFLGTDETYPRQERLLSSVGCLTHGVFFVCPRTSSPNVPCVPTRFPLAPVPECVGEI
jgi:hypothetical protein